ncbi:MAG: HAD family phosphatase [Rhizobiaceae bacterium]|nr:HAD family phosphatase [Rhizobiaceae bacterium]
MTSIQHIVFDIGSVLIHYDPNIPFSRLIPDESERRWFFENVCTSAWNIEQDRGRTWEDAEALLIQQHPDHENNIRAFRKYWHEMVSHSYDDTVAIMLGLIDKDYDVTMLTNFASDTFVEARKKFDFLNRPRGVTVSGLIKEIKPNRAIYERHTSDFELHAPATLFIDDNQANVAAAQEFGWNAVRYKDAPTLLRDLASYGIVI